ncbi:MAG: hypothetical protein NZ455_07065 [Bacteroidia bacterium]|nr:hypothetical protein [Bacteroidia bacterium]MDW8345403.1 hypothetical protein [Bacteroidia bacterium]
MREACGGQAVRLGAKPPRLCFYPCPRGGGVAPPARSTPTLPTRAQRAVGKDTPKIQNNNSDTSQ